MYATHRHRRGFTLVELLVGIGIMMVLATLALVFVNSGVISNHRLSGGSDRVSGWLLQARARAQREAAPRGVRFIPDASGLFIREAQLIEVPDPITPPAGTQLVIGQWQEGANIVRRVYIVAYSPLLSNAQQQAVLSTLANRLSAGDTLSIRSSDTLHRVTSTALTSLTYGGVAGVPALEVRVDGGPVVSPGLPQNKLPDLGTGVGTFGVPTYATPTYGFHRQARPVMGEPSLLVPEGIAIDVLNCDAPPSADATLPAGTFDLIFAPNGELIGTGGRGRVILWIRNPEALTGSPRVGGDLQTTYEQAGPMSLIVVYTRTGKVDVQPVNVPTDDNPVTPHDPFLYTKDGKASGL